MPRVEAKVDRRAINTALSGFSDAYAKASADTGFTPEPGKYLVRLADISTGVFTPKKGKSAGEEHVRVVFQFEIAEGPLVGQSFDMFTSTIVAGIMKSALQAVSGVQVDDPQLALAEAEKAIDSFFEVDAFLSKDGKYTNYKILNAVSD